MSRYIDADKLSESIKLSIKSWGRDCNSNAPKMVTAYQDVLYRLERAPTADVVEVVRCKDCTRRQTDTFGRTVCVRQGQMIAIEDNDFCSNGERREG